MSWDGEMDELIALSEERIAALLEFRDPAEEEKWSVYEIMRHGCRVIRTARTSSPCGRKSMSSPHPQTRGGLQLEQLPLLRPVTNTERWRVDERKVEQGRKKTKKKFVIV